MYNIDRCAHLATWTVLIATMSTSKWMFQSIYRYDGRNVSQPTDQPIRTISQPYAGKLPEPMRGICVKTTMSLTIDTALQKHFTEVCVL